MSYEMSPASAIGTRRHVLPRRAPSTESKRYKGQPGALIHASINRLPPPATSRQATNPADLTRAVKVGFILNSFSFGGSETETIELVEGVDPRVIRFAAIAVASALRLPKDEPRKDGKFPPIYMPFGPMADVGDARVRIVRSFLEAVEIVTGACDIVITWGVPNLQDFLPWGRLPKLVIHSKDSSEWAASFLYPNALATTHYSSNSALAAAAFPKPIHNRVKIIHNGINPRRVIPRLGCEEQREIWGLHVDDKIAGYLGRIVPDKGVRKTVDAILRLPQEWKAVFVGSNPNDWYSNELWQYCESMIPGRYRLLPWTHDVGSALAAFDVFCHPSEHEGFSNSIAEAWLAGIPTVYTESTGAVPELGELGVGVSPDADGEEIAGALLKAYGNQEMAIHAREVMATRFSPSANARRWIEYLLELYHHPEMPRALLLSPLGFAAFTHEWVAAFKSTAVDFELCCVAFEGECNQEHSAVDAMIYENHHCPCFHISVADDLEELIRYTRPHILLTFQSPALTRLLPAYLTMPLLLLPARPDQESTNWIRWSRYIAREVSEHVFAQD